MLLANKEAAAPENGAAVFVYQVFLTQEVICKISSIFDLNVGNLIENNLEI